MRWALPMVLMLAACGPAPTPADRASLCRDAFQRYDRAVDRQRALDFGGIGQTAGIAVPDETAATARLRQFDCILFGADLPAPLADTSIARAPALGAQGPRGYVHVGTLAGDALASDLAADLRALGWPVETRGALGIGRRVFIGPVFGAAPQAAALNAALSLGYDTAYPLSRVP